MSDDWSFLTTHALALLFVAQEPDSRLRHIADAVGVTERTAHTLMRELADAGYVATERDGRRNIYHVQTHLPVRDSIGRQRAIGDLVDLFDDAEPL
jgi:DNA-binding MarR family transcriptional regulator